MRLVALALLIGCGKPAEVEVDPVTMDEAKAFSAEILKAAFPCDEAKLRPLVDEAAMGARFRKGSRDIANTTASWELEREHVGASTLCAWQSGALDYKLLRVRMVDGQPRPMFRRLVKLPRDNMTAVAYEETLLGKSRVDHKIHIIDIYSYVQGGWLTDLLRGATDAVIESASDHPLDADDYANKMKRARSLQDQGQPKEALAIVDSLPAMVRDSRTTQMMRVALAGAISEDAYKTALDEVGRKFPNDPSIALLQVDGAFLRNDYDAALRYIDQVDKAIGGDTWQDALRAQALTQRNKPGDLATAAQVAKRAVTAEPTLEKAWWAVLDVALLQRDWTVSLATMDELNHRFKIPFDDATLRSIEVYAGLVATPQYKAWQKAR